MHFEENAFCCLLKFHMAHGQSIPSSHYSVQSVPPHMQNSAL